MNATQAAFASIFTTSNPETRPDWCDSIGSWRCAHADTLGHALIASGENDCYTFNGESEAKECGIRGPQRVLGIGHRRSEDLAPLAEKLRGFGLDVREGRGKRRVDVLYIVDSM